jgi:hypothetical protein
LLPTFAALSPRTSSRPSSPGSCEAASRRTATLRGSKPFGLDGDTGERDQSEQRDRRRDSASERTRSGRCDVPTRAARIFLRNAGSCHFLLAASERCRAASAVLRLASMAARHTGSRQRAFIFSLRVSGGSASSAARRISARLWTGSPVPGTSPRGTSPAICVARRTRRRGKCGTPVGRCGNTSLAAWRLRAGVHAEAAKEAQWGVRPIAAGGGAETVTSKMPSPSLGRPPPLTARPASRPLPLRTKNALPTPQAEGVNLRHSGRLWRGRPGGAQDAARRLPRHATGGQRRAPGPNLPCLRLRPENCRGTEYCGRREKNKKTFPRFQGPVQAPRAEAATRSSPAQPLHPPRCQTAAAALQRCRSDCVHGGGR